jgi:D-alanyl-D-alanine carboxypeptidase
VILPSLLLLRSDLDRTALEAALLKAKAPAVAAALVQDGKVVWSGGKGATGDTVFRLASLTKAFTATIVLQLVNEKKVGLDDPIGKSLPNLPKAWQGATIRNLLNHTSGIPSYTDVPDFIKHIEERWTPQQIVDQTADKPLNFPSGSKFEYDNTGYVILGILVEKLDHRSFADALQRRILKPLGMKNTRLNEGAEKAEALGFDEKGAPAIAINMSQPYAAGSIVSTANDMGKWIAAQGSTKLLPAPLWSEMLKPTTLTTGNTSTYGFGWGTGQVNGVATVEHGGGIPGYATLVRRVPSKGLGVVVLTNSEGSNPSLAVNAILAAVDPTLKPSDTAIPDPDPKVTEATRKLLKQIAEGNPDKSMMAKAFADGLKPEMIEGAKALFATLGEMKELRLLKVDGARRIYLAKFESRDLKITMSMDAEGHFATFAISPA